MCTLALASLWAIMLIACTGGDQRRKLEAKTEGEASLSSPAEIRQTLADRDLALAELVVIDEVSVELDGFQPDAQWQAMWKSALREAGFQFAPVELTADVRSRLVLVEVSAAQRVLADHSALVALDVRYSWRGGGDDATPRVREAFPLTKRDTARSLFAPDSVMRTTVGRVAQVLFARERLRTGAVEAVTTALRAKDSAEVQWGLQVVADRGMPGALSDVTTLLQAELGDTRKAAVRALRAIGDPAAVVALANHAERTAQSDEQIELIDAIAQLGGENAETYLELRKEDPNPRIRLRAESALAKMRAASRRAVAQ